MHPDQDNPSPTVEDSLRAAIETVESTPAEVTTEAAPAPDTSSESRARQPDGKFAPKEAVGKLPDPKATTDTPAHVAAQAPAVPGQPAAQPQGDASAPQSWKEPVKALWEKLPPEVREEVQRREREIEVGLRRASEVRKFGDSIMAEFQPYAEILQGEGATPQGAMRALLETAYVLRHGSPEHKHALFMSLAQQYGIDVTRQINPDLARAQWEADSMKLGQTRQAVEQETRQVTQIQQEISAFANSPGHEHFTAVRPRMIALLANGAAEGLQDAYEQACWADPQVRPLLMQAENMQRAQSTAKNRAAASGVSGAPGSVSTEVTTDHKNLRASLEAAVAGNRL